MKLKTSSFLAKRSQHIAPNNVRYVTLKCCHRLARALDLEDLPPSTSDHEMKTSNLWQEEV